MLLVACNGTANDFQYKTAFSMAKFDPKGIIIQKYVGTNIDVTVPNRLNGKEVRSVEEYAFTGTNVEILRFQSRVSDSLHVYEALNLRKLYLPNSDDWYFIPGESAHISGCSKLEEIHFPPMFYAIGDNDYRYGRKSPSIVDCKNLRKMYFYNSHAVAEIWTVNALFESDLPKTFYDDLTVYVPSNMLNEYRQHKIWKTFNLQTFDAVWVEP